jgi:hypothetical protein
MIGQMGGNRRFAVSARALRAAGISATIGLAATMGLSSCSHGSPGPDRSGSNATSGPSAPVATASRDPSWPADIATTGPNLRNAGEQPPRLPAGATKNSGAGATAFAQFFVQTIDWGFATTSANYMAHYFDPACDECQQQKSGLEATASQGWHFVGGRYTIRSAALTAGSQTNATVLVTVAIAASKTVDRAGTVQSSTPADSDFGLRLSLVWQQSNWVVVGLDVPG